MKTDLERTIGFFSSINIEAVPYKREEEYIIEIGAKTQPKVVGYTAFFTEFTFDKEGKFISMGIWE